MASHNSICGGAVVHLCDAVSLGCHQRAITVFRGELAFVAYIWSVLFKLLCNISFQKPLLVMWNQAKT